MKRFTVTNESKSKLSEPNTDIQSARRKDKNNYYSNICSEIGSHAIQNQVKDFFLKIKQITGQFSAKNWVVENDRGEDVTEIDNIL